MSQAITPLFWVIITLLILLFMQRWIHTHLHGLSLLLMGKPERAVVLYALVLFPGVLLHEVSHWLAATFVGVRTGKLSLRPRQHPDGSIQLGYVEYYKGRGLDPVRESLIGGAPLISGTIIILLIGYQVFDVTALAELVQTGQMSAVGAALRQLYQTPDFLLWLYLLFAIANGMMPSKSDRRAWPGFVIVMVILAIIVYWLGLADRVIIGLAEPVTTMLRYLSLAFAMAVGVDIVFMIVIAIAENVIGRMKGVSVVYNNGRTNTS